MRADTRISHLSRLWRQVTVTGTWNIVAPLDADTESFLYARSCGEPAALLSAKETQFSPNSACETSLAAATVETVLALDPEP